MCHGPLCKEFGVPYQGYPPPSWTRNLLTKLLVFSPLGPQPNPRNFRQKSTLKLHRYLNEPPICLRMELFTVICQWFPEFLEHYGWLGTLVWGIQTGFLWCKWSNIRSKNRKQIHHVWGAWNAILKKVTYFIPTPSPNKRYRLSCRIWMAVCIQCPSDHC